jgi:hypothetical protein
LTSFTNVITKGCFGLLIASLDIERMPRMQFKRVFSVPPLSKKRPYGRI